MYLVIAFQSLFTFFRGGKGGCSGPLLDALQVEDVVAVLTAPYLISLHDTLTADHALIRLSSKLLSQFITLNCWSASELFLADLRLIMWSMFVL